MLTSLLTGPFYAMAKKTNDGRRQKEHRPRGRKPSGVPQEKKEEPIKDTPPVLEQPAPGAKQASAVETVPEVPQAPTTFGSSGNDHLAVLACKCYSNT